MMDVLVRAGSIMMFLAVAMGAFGAHALKNVLSEEMKPVFETAVRYQAYHALAMFAALWIGQSFETKSGVLAAKFFLAGILLFSGSLYGISIFGIRKLGMITPIGGLLFLIGWGLLAFASYKS